jgi:hypothetical protein
MVNIRGSKLPTFSCSKSNDERLGSPDIDTGQDYKILRIYFYKYLASTFILASSLITVREDFRI